MASRFCLHAQTDPWMRRCCRPPVVDPVDHWIIARTEFSDRKAQTPQFDDCRLDVDAQCTERILEVVELMILRCLLCRSMEAEIWMRGTMGVVDSKVVRHSKGVMSLAQKA